MRKLSVWEIELWKDPLRILLKEHHWREVVVIIKEAKNLEKLLLILFEDEDEVVRKNSIRVMSNLENSIKFYPQFKKALNDLNSFVRVEATKQISKFKKNEPRKLILKLLKDETDTKVIPTILKSLKEIGELEDIRLIAPLIKSESSNVANEARQAITQINNRQTQPTRIEQAKDFLRTSDKLTIVEVPVFVILLSVGIVLWTLDLQEATLWALLFTYAFGRLRALKKPSGG